MPGLPASIRPRGALLGLALALPPLLLLRGFTVDDAWIPARYAVHLASGLGLRFNPGDPVSDGVTPLPWTPLLALLAPVATGAAPPTIGGVWHTARAIGVVAWLAAAARLGHHVARPGGPPARWLALAPLALSAPLGAWAWGGLETGLTTLLVTLAATTTGRRSALAAGLGASLRPEAIVLAVSLSALRPAPSPRARLTRALVAATPWLAVVAVRLACFGRPYPLSVLAKPSDLSHGLAYVVAGLLLAGAPLLACSPRALRASDGETRALLGAALLHAGAVAWAGGDWMPLSRLLVPSLPLWMVAAARLERGRGSEGPVDTGPSPPAPTGPSFPLSLLSPLLRGLLASAAMLFTWWRVGAPAREVVPVRAALIAQARPVLAPFRAVASLDAGWVGAATTSRVVDLAGLTDVAIAQLPGGHTSKRIPGAMLADRGVEALLLLRRRGVAAADARDDGGPYDRQVEERLAADPWVQGHLRPGPVLTSGELSYVLWTARRADEP